MCRLSWYCDFGVDDRLKHRHLKKKPQPQLFARRLLIQNQLTLYCDTHFINIQPSGNLWSYLLCIGHEKQVIIGYQCFWWCKRVWTGRRDSQQLSSSLLSRQSWSPSHSQSLDTQRPSAQRCSRARSHTDTHTHKHVALWDCRHGHKAFRPVTIIIHILCCFVCVLLFIFQYLFHILILTSCCDIIIISEA